MKLHYSADNALRGMLIYSIGDTAAAVLLNEFSAFRLLGMMLIGSTIYAVEIPNYFLWIDKKFPRKGNSSGVIYRTLLAILYFNPLWISRHLLFIKIFTLNTDQIDFYLLTLGAASFVVNIPISVAANYIIQNFIKYKNRFLASAVFSSLMAVYYALSELIFK